MIKYFWLILLPLWCGAQSNAPTTTDKIIATADSIKSHDPAKALKLLDDVKKQLDSTNQPLQYGHWAIVYGAIFDGRDDYKTALTYYLTALRNFEKTGDKIAIAKAYNNIGGIWYSLSDFDQAMKYHRMALVIRQATHDKKLSSTYSNMGILYYEHGDYVSALKNYFAGFNVAQKFHDINMMASLCTNIAVTYMDQKNYAEAAVYAQNAFKYHAQLNDYQGMATASNNLGAIYLDQEKLDEAMPYFKQAIVYAQKTGSQTPLGIAYNNMAEIAFDKKDYRTALNYAEQGLAVRRKIGTHSGIIRSLIKVAEAGAALKNNKLAQDSFDEALKLAVPDGNLREQKRIYQKLATFYKQQGLFEKALAYQQQYQKSADSLFNKDNMRTINELQTQFETQKKQQQIKLLQQQNTIQQFTITRRNTFIGVIGGILVVAIILGALFYNRNKLKQEAKLQAELIKQREAAAKGIIEAEERERKRIAGDLHDGVGQLFSTVRLNLSSLLELLPADKPGNNALAEKTLALVDESCREVRSMAHQMMPNILLRTGLASAVRDFVTKIDENRLKVNLQTSGLDQRLDNDTEIVLYRVIQECVNNVIKHAAANRLDIQLNRDGNEISATIEDNGKGFDTGASFEGIGLKNMVSRLAYLKGTVDFSSAPGKGTLVAIYVPLT